MKSEEELKLLIRRYKKLYDALSIKSQELRDNVSEIVFDDKGVEFKQEIRVEDVIEKAKIENADDVSQVNLDQFNRLIKLVGDKRAFRKNEQRLHSLRAYIRILSFILEEQTEPKHMKGAESGDFTLEKFNE